MYSSCPSRDPESEIDVEVLETRLPLKQNAIGFIGTFEPGKQGHEKVEKSTCAGVENLKSKSQHNVSHTSQKITFFQLEVL